MKNKFLYSFLFCALMLISALGFSACGGQKTYSLKYERIGLDDIKNEYIWEGFIDSKGLIADQIIEDFLVISPGLDHTKLKIYVNDELIGFDVYVGNVKTEDSNYTDSREIKFKFKLTKDTIVKVDFTDCKVYTFKVFFDSKIQDKIMYSYLLKSLTDEKNLINIDLNKITFNVLNKSNEVDFCYDGNYLIFYEVNASNKDNFHTINAYKDKEHTVSYDYFVSRKNIENQIKPYILENNGKTYQIFCIYNIDMPLYFTIVENTKFEEFNIKLNFTNLSKEFLDTFDCYYSLDILKDFSDWIKIDQSTIIETTSYSSIYFVFKDKNSKSDQVLTLYSSKVSQEEKYICGGLEEVNSLLDDYNKISINIDGQDKQIYSLKYGKFDDSLPGDGEYYISDK